MEGTAIAVSLFSSSLRAKRSNPPVRLLHYGLLRRFAPRNDESHMPDFFRHVIKRRVPVDLGFRRLEHHALLARIVGGDRMRRHHPDREPLAAAGVDVA